MIELTIPSIQEYLKSAKHDPIFQQETNQLILLFKIEKVDFPIFFRVFEGGDLLQMISFIPCNLKTTAVPDLARLLHFINKEIDLPGFGLDEKAGIIYYRQMLIGSNKQIDEKAIESLIQSIKISCETFAPVISAVAVAATTFADVFKKAQSSNVRGKEPIL